MKLATSSQNYKIKLTLQMVAPNTKRSKKSYGSLRQTMAFSSMYIREIWPWCGLFPFNSVQMSIPRRLAMRPTMLRRPSLLDKVPTCLSYIRVQINYRWWKSKMLINSTFWTSSTTKNDSNCCLTVRSKFAQTKKAHNVERSHAPKSSCLSPVV